VPDTEPRSNAGLVKAKLLQNRAAGANFLPLYQSGDAGADMKEASRFLSTFFNPPDVAILGMGNDGHTASFFPDAVELEKLLDPQGTHEIASVHAQSAGELRLTLTLPLIARARFIALHIEGEEKQAALEKALSPGSTLPIRRMIDAAKTPVEIFWAP
jgi:6-phosphogluconolactonase